MSKAKAMVPPINCIFGHLQQQTPVTFWLYEQVGIRIRGTIRGFDEFMNVVIDDAVEVPVDVKTGTEQVDKGTKLGRILLKGDNITLITPLESL
ncbi:Small nuclear ribonucleoprotein E [Nakaseomyces bracarensis]|uniref:Small nuclear ribonucleoprotein E n=1 Tax=Nakaseomyces bracarensis TaxID=273131 RepID=A0ABR4NWX0_9SACH